MNSRAYRRHSGPQGESIDAGGGPALPDFVSRRVDEGFSVRLVEITPECHLGGPCKCGNCGWDSRRFRRVTLAEDLKRSVFRELLGTLPDKDALRPILKPPCVINGRRA